MRIIIEINNGVVVGVTTTAPAEYFVVDYDNLDKEEASEFLDEISTSQRTVVRDFQTPSDISLPCDDPD